MPKKKSTKKNIKLNNIQYTPNQEYKQKQLWINFHPKLLLPKHFLFLKAPGYVTHAYDLEYLQRKKDIKKI